MPLENDFIAGLDPTPLGNISAAQLLQMINQAIPSTKRGIIYFSTVTPDIISNPQIIQYIWLDPSAFPIVPKIFNQNTATWEPLTNAPLSITGAQIADGTIGPEKLTPGGAYQLLRTDSTGLAVEWWTLSFPANSIDVNSLQIGAGLPGNLLRIKLDGSGIEWYTFVLSDYLTVSSIPWNAIQNSGIPGDVLYVQDIAGNLSWANVLALIASNSFPIDKISPGTPDSYLRTNPAGNAVIWDATSPVNLPHGLFVDITPAGPASFTVPANVFSLDVEVVGGGGGGCTTNVAGNIGGAGGGWGRKIIAVTPGQIISYEVGAGGATGAPGSIGGDTNFNTTLIGLGGQGGDVAGAVIAGGSFSGADIGCAGLAGGSTFPGNFINVGTISLATMLFMGGKSGCPVAKVADFTANGGTFGCGGASIQPAVGGSDAIVADPGVNGAVIIRY